MLRFIGCQARLPCFTAESSWKPDALARDSIGRKFIPRLRFGLPKMELRNIETRAPGATSRASRRRHR